MQARPERPASDIHLRNARVIDGTGEEPFRGDVIVRDNPIAAVCAASMRGSGAHHDRPKLAEAGRSCRLQRAS
jgi:N-acyl-D-aspartate/D-glutamate deacylase